jgi:hypothetical protein
MSSLMSNHLDMSEYFSREKRVAMAMALKPKEFERDFPVRAHLVMSMRYNPESDTIAPFNTLLVEYQHTPCHPFPMRAATAPNYRAFAMIPISTVLSDKTKSQYKTNKWRNGCPVDERVHADWGSVVAHLKTLLQQPVSPQFYTPLNGGDRPGVSRQERDARKRYIKANNLKKLHVGDFVRNALTVAHNTEE